MHTSNQTFVLQHFLDICHHSTSYTYKNRLGYVCNPRSLMEGTEMRPAVCQCVCAEGALGQREVQLAVGGLGEANRSTWASPNRLQISRIVSGWSRHSPGLSRGWGSGDTAGRYLLAVYRGAMPTSGPGSVASAEVVSYEAIRAAWLQLRMPYAPGASETVSVVPHACLWRNSGSSALLGHVPPWGVPSYSPSLTPHREKRFSAQGRACSFPSWPEAPTGWGAGAPSPCDRPTALWIGLG